MVARNSIVVGVTAAIETMEARRWAAMISTDVEALREMFHDDMRYTHSNAQLDTKESYLRAIADPSVVDYRNVETSDVQIQEVGDVGLVNGRAHFSVLAGGKELELDSQYTAVWIRSGGDWQFLAWHNTPLPG